MTNLIARLEAASEGSRELDEAIATAIWGAPRPSGNVGCPRTLVWWHNGLGRSVVPEFTTSLDAALTLVPEGKQWILDCCDRIDGGTWRYSAHVVGSTDKSWWRPTPSLALCIAALKARQEQPK